MKISLVTVADLKAYANVYHNEDDVLFGTILAASKHFIAAYTGIPLIAADPTTENDLDDYEDLTIALFILSNEMYDNRMVSTDAKNVSFVVKQLLDSHSINLL